MLFQLKQRDKVNIGHVDMAIPAVEEVLHMSIYPLLESTGISDGVSKMRAVILLGDIFRLHQRTKIH